MIKNLKTKHCILILVILSIIFLNDMFLHPTNVFQERDHKDMFLYLYNYRQESFQNYGQFPLWDTHKYSGMFPDVNTPHFYPFDILFLFIFKDQFLNFFIFLHLFLAGVFTYFFARSLKLKEFPSLISAIVFMFSGRIIVLIGGSISQLATVSLIPLVFWMFQLLLKNKKPINVVLLGLVIGLQFLAGELQYFFITCLGLGIYFLFNLILLRKNQKQIFKLFYLFIISLILGLSISSIHLIPSLEFTTHLSRIDGSLIDGSSYEYATSAGSLPLQQTITSVMPFAFGNAWQGIYWGAPEQASMYFYLGIFPLLLALLSLLFVRNKYTWFFFGLAVFALLYSFGKYTPFFYILFKLVPGVNLFRIPAKMMVLYSLSIAIMSGFGVSYLLNKIKAKDKKILKKISKGLFWITTLSFITVVLTFLFKTQIISFGENMLHTMYYQTYADSIFVQQNSYESLLNLISSAYNIIYMSVLAFSILFFLASLLFYSRIKDKISINTFKILLIIFLFSDIAFYGIGIHSISFGSSDNVIENNEVLEFLKHDNSLHRVFVSDQKGIFSQYASVKYNIQQFLGIGSSRLNHFDTFLEEGIDMVDSAHAKVKWGSLTVPANLTNHSYSSKLLGMMNVKYLLSKEELNDKNYVFKKRINNINIYENKNLLPRAFIVPEAKFSGNKDLILNRMKEDSFDPKKTVILEKQVSIINTNDTQEFKKAEIKFYSPNKISIYVETDAPSFLVLSDVWYPAWKAYDNGKEVEIYKTNYVIRSVYLDKGKHNIEFIYDSIYFRIGKIITLITLLLIFLYFVYYYRTQVKTQNLKQTINQNIL